MEKIQKWASTVARLMTKLSEISFNESLSMAERSDRMMEECRHLRIYVRYRYLSRFESSNNVTIDPYSEDVKLELASGEKLVDPTHPDPNDFVEVPAYSFGPVNADAFFKSPIRSVWILKEAYCEDSTELIERLFLTHPEMCNQAFTYGSCKTLQYATILNVLNRTHKMREVLGTVVADEEVEMRKSLESMCVLNVNPFPGLAFHGTHSDVNMSKWAEIFKPVIKLLVDFYNADVNTFGHTLELFGSYGNFDVVQRRFVDGTLKVMGDPILEWAYIDSVTDEEVIIRKSVDSSKAYPSETRMHNVGRTIKYLGASGRIYVQSNHPSRNYKPALQEIDCTRIKEWLSPSGLNKPES